MPSIVDPASGSKPPRPREFGPGHPYWPCPICAGLRPSSVSPLIQAKHIEHAMVEPVVDEDDFRLACRLVQDWRKNSDGSAPELIDRITAAITAQRSAYEAVADDLDAQAEDLHPMGEQSTAYVYAAQRIRQVVR